MSPAPLLVALLTAGPTPASAGPPPALLRALAEVPAGPARAVAATAPLLGRPYARDPLGEGAGPDPDPRFRLDAFDCMTFVETALALGSSGSLDEAARALDDVRYEGAPRLERRHHEVLSQWLPANVARGWIAAATQGLPGARWEERDYSAAGWAALHRAGRAIPGLPPAREPLGRFGAWVLAPADVAAAAPLLPEGALVFVVRADAPLRATRVSHAGLLVIGPGGARRVRHATSSVRFQKVIEESLASFLLREQAAFPAWPVTGLTFYRVLDARPRLAAAALESKGL